MKVLITGGTGFIGTNLALAYLARGWEVRVLGKRASAAEAENVRDLLAAGAEVMEGSVTETALLRQACAGVAVVHHIAAAMREANIPDAAFWEINVHATRRLLDAARDSGVRRFVYCSSIGAMGKHPPKPATETTPCRPADIYQRTKRAAEELCAAYAAEHGFPIAVVRPAEVYGPRDRRLLKLFRSVQNGSFVMIGNGRNEHHLVYVDDMTRGFLLAAEREEAVGQTFIIAGEEAVSSWRLVEEIAQALGARLRRVHVPLGPVRALAFLVEGACRPLGIQPPLYPRRVDFFRGDFRFDISKARNMLGYAPQFSLARGIRATADWYRERQWL